MVVKLLCDVIIDGFQFFAMSTPWSIEFNQDMTELLNNVREVSISQDKDVVLFSVG